MSPFLIVVVIFAVSQLYWGWQLYRLTHRIVLCFLASVVWWLLFQYTFTGFRTRGHIEPTFGDFAFAAPFAWWAASSLVGFIVAMLVAMPRAIGRKRRRAEPDPGRRHFLEQAATVATAAPFVAGAYGLLYGRLNLETSSQIAHLPHLPKAFDGFRICQLSDIHIGPFMPADEIRKYVAIANSLKADMIVLTGDFVTFDPTTQQPVVEALSGLRAPFGKFGCLGNHDAWSGVEDSITELFRQTGVRILRGESLPIVTNGESFNLIGVDFESPHSFGPSPAVPNLLGDIEGLIKRDRANILLSHNPDTFPRAAELGIELSLAGHTHGGQAALEFISPQIAPSRLATPYVAGWFRKPGGQLYVNRGIGTIGVPIRLGAPPEITVYTLKS